MGLREEIEEIKQAIDIASKVKSGNIGGAIKSAANLLKSKKFRKKLLKILIMAIMKILIPLLIVVVSSMFIFSAFTAIADKLNELKGNFVEFTTSFWKVLTQDYWIDLDREIENEVSYESDEEKVTETLVDSYMREIEAMGLSLKDLRLLGDADYETDNPLKEEYNKKLVQRYIKEFIRADIISQEIHRRTLSNDLVNPLNPDEVDGGVFLYRSKNELTNNEKLQKSKMKFEEYDKFYERIENKDKNAEDYFTIDKDTGMLIIAQVNTKEVKQKIDNGGWTILEDTVEITDKKIDYKSSISKYTLPFEYLISLCEVTQNPEFVLRVALMARDTDIRLVVLDNITKDETTEEEETTTTTLENIGSDDAASASVVSEVTSKVTTKTTITQSNPDVVTEEVRDSWIYKAKKVYTKTYTETEVENGPNVQENEKPSKLQDTGRTVNIPSVKPDNTTSTNPLTDITQSSSTSSVLEQNIMGSTQTTTTAKVYAATYVSKVSKTTTTNTKTNTYNGQLAEKEVIKSDEYLGLLRNKQGVIIDLSDYAAATVNTLYGGNPITYGIISYIFDYIGDKLPFGEGIYKFDKNGINVAYIIPNTTKVEMPINKLTSGAEMLFSLLRQNSKTQDLEQVMRYLLQFPTGKDYGVTQDDIENLFNITDPPSGSVTDGDIIVKTDLAGAAPAVTKEQLIQIINSYFRTASQRQNALSVADTLIADQNTYQVNAVFELALLQKETSVGTANTGYVKNDNNWTSYSLGTKYASPSASVDASMKNIATGSHYFTQGKYTIREIGLTYCPNMPEYPTQGDDWVACVTSYVVAMYNCIGIDVSSSSSGESGSGGSGGGPVSPGTGTSTEYTSSSGKHYINYKQFDPLWASHPFAGGTMQNSGCSITAIAIILSGYGNNTNPDQIRASLGGQTTELTTLLQKYGISNHRVAKKLTSADIVNQLKTGKPIIVLVGGPWASSSGHYMALLDYKKEGGKDYVYVSNPGKNNSHYNGWYDVNEIAPYTLPSRGSIYIDQ